MRWWVIPPDLRIWGHCPAGSCLLLLLFPAEGEARELYSPAKGFALLSDLALD